jgi:hypothetical protein
MRIAPSIIQLAFCCFEMRAFCEADRSLLAAAIAAANAKGGMGTFESTPLPPDIGDESLMTVAARLAPAAPSSFVTPVTARPRPSAMLELNNWRGFP